MEYGKARTTFTFLFLPVKHRAPPSCFASKRAVFHGKQLGTSLEIRKGKEDERKTTWEGVSGRMMKGRERRE
jgi:hypothetical protein